MPKELIAKIIIVAGIFLVLFGGLLLIVNKIPGIGKLPGDICITRKNFAFYFPIATSIIISLILSLILYLLSKRQ